MTIHLKKYVIEAVLFSLFYFITFLLTIKQFSDGAETSAMFVMISFLASCLIIVYYTLLRMCFYFLSYKPGVLIKGLIFFILSELAVLTFTGELPFFGLARLYNEQHSLYTFPKNDLYVFRQTRDLMLSMSGLIAAILFAATRQIYFYKKSKELRNR